MPVITIDGMANASKETKREIIEKVSRDVAEAYDVPLDIITVIIHDIPPENAGINGKQVG